MCCWSAYKRNNLDSPEALATFASSRRRLRLSVLPQPTQTDSRTHQRVGDRLTYYIDTGEMMRAYFIRNTSHPTGIVRHTTTTSTLPPSSLRPITPPRYPHAARTSLTSMRPLVFITRFACEQRCRSYGICIHFQFCCGVSSCPDGLVCDRCVVGQADEMVRWSNLPSGSMKNVDI